MDKVRARVISVVERPLRVILELSNAQRAVLTTTGITNSFSEAVSAMQAFELNEVRAFIMGLFNLNFAAAFVLLILKVKLPNRSDFLVFLRIHYFQ